MNCANHPDRDKIAFCQNCGKPLCTECARTVGAAVYCEPCLAIKIAGAAAPIRSYGYADPVSGVDVGGVYASGIIPPKPPHGSPSPILAGILGFIPGVGAMYNEQYAKAGVHLIVFVVLVSLANSTDIFGFFVAGWEFYMAFEAFHTARCRRDGLPLPNPFGLNDLGHKLGFDKSSWNGAASPAPPPVDPYSSPSTPPPAYPAQSYPAPVAAPDWGMPPTPPWEQYAPPMPPPVPLDAQVPYPGNRFPAGAIWLIALGALFLLFNAGIFQGITVRLFLPTLLLGVAIFIFVRKMTSYGYGFSNDGSTVYRIRIFRALRSSVWVALVGLLFFLDEFTPLKWDRSWPLFIILAGVMTFLQRAVYSGAASSAQPPYSTAYGYPPQTAPSVPQPPPVASSEIVAPGSRNQEGS